MASTHDRILAWLQSTPTYPDPSQSSPPHPHASFSIASSDESVTSDQSSTCKVFSALSLKPDGIDRKPLYLDDETMPEALVDLLMDIENISRGEKVVPRRLKKEVLGLAGTKRSFSAFMEHVFDDAPGEEQRVGTTLNFGLHHIFGIINNANLCQSLDRDVAGWNSVVHTRLLDIAHWDYCFRDWQLDGFTECNTARITPRYCIQDIPGNQVNYVLHLDPQECYTLQAVSDAMETLRSTIPNGFINPTSHPRLLRKPITVSIVTSGSGDSQRKARLKMGVWQAAQWKMLRELAGEAISELEMIPGVIVEGHEWRFVATTNVNGKTTLWADQNFGNTKTALGVFQIIAGIQRLRKWAARVFWPWYLKRVLEVDGDEGRSESPNT